MIELATELIETLCQQLGVAKDYLWPLLVRQAYISGFVKLGVCAGFFISLVVLAKSVKYWFIDTQKYVFTQQDSYFIPGLDKSGKETKINQVSRYTYHNSQDTEWLPITIHVALIAITFTLFLCLMTNIWDVFTALLNPEYYAIEQLINMLT